MAPAAGERLDVADIVTTVRQNENSPEEAADYLDLPVAHVQAAIRYYVDFQDEIDAEIGHAAAIAERERELFERQQRAFG